jgi:alkylated DNA repair dioxygenase AlkB
LPRYLSVQDARELYTCVAAESRWCEESIRLFGRELRVPRRCAWYGDAGVTYRYSRLVHRAEGWSPTTAQLRDALAERLGVRFNFVLLNLYRDGADGMGWHSDDEPELGAQPCIASLSLGAARRFCLRSRDATRRRLQVTLEAGSLLLMWGDSQRDWEHALPKTRTPVAPRINLTFRQVSSGG